MSLLPDGAPHGVVQGGQQGPAFTEEDINSLMPRCCVTMPVIENFFRSQFEACLRQENAQANLASCLVFGPDTWADLRRLLLPAEREAGAGQQSFPALERFCRGQDIASKQYLLLPLLTAGHGSLLVVCKPVKQQGRPADMYSPPQPSRSKRFESEALAEQPSSQEPLILHLDSGCTANCQHEPDCRSLVSFLRPYLAEDKDVAANWANWVQCLNASVPQQLSPGLGSTFMCTSAVYFVATQPPYLKAGEVKRLRDYKQRMVDMFERRIVNGELIISEECVYPGFLTSEWYPRNVPEALRKLLLSGVMERLKAQCGHSAAATALARAHEVQTALHKASARQFQMPAQRLSKQLEMKQGRLLAAGRRYWEREGWKRGGLSGTVKCQRGTWSIALLGNPRTTGLRLEDVVHQPSRGPPQPAEFDLCFGVQLKQGQQPPPFVIHVPLHLLSTEAQAAATAAGLKDQPVDMRFESKPFTAGQRTFWPLEKSCWDALCSHLGTSLDGCCKLSLVHRPGTGGKGSLVHVDLELQHVHTAQQAQQQVQQCPRQARQRPQQQRAANLPPASRRSRGSQQTAGTGVASDLAQQSGGSGSLRDTSGSPGADVDGQASPQHSGGAPDLALPDAAGGKQHEAGTADGDDDPMPSPPGSPQHTAGTAGTADLADMAAASSLAALHAQPWWAAGIPPAAATAARNAALQPTEKGVKRLQTGSDGHGDRRARLTVRGQKYYAGYFPTGAAAAQAEDLMVMWVHCSSTGWPEGWMQSCANLDHKLNFPYALHVAKHESLVASLSSCRDKDALRLLLQKHLNSDGQQPPDGAESSQQPASQGGPSASSHSGQQAAAAAPESDGNQQPVASGGEKRPAPAESAAAGSSLGAKRQRGAAAAERPAGTQSLRSSGSARGMEPQQAQQLGAAAGQPGIESAVEQLAQQGPQQVPQLVQLAQGEADAMDLDAAAAPAPSLRWEPGQDLAEALVLQLPEFPLWPGLPPKQEQDSALLSMHSWAAGQQPALQLPAGWLAGAAPPGQQAQPPMEAASAAGGSAGPHPPLLPASRGLAALQAMLQSSSPDSGWPADVRQQAADALAAIKVPAPDDELLAAQVKAILAALKPLGVPISKRLACTRQFRKLPAGQRRSLLAELGAIALEGSTHDLDEWMHELLGTKLVPGLPPAH